MLNNKMITIMLNRGYEIKIKRDICKSCNNIIILGNYSKSNYNATCIVSKYGISPTVRENHGQVTAILDEVK